MCWANVTCQKIVVFKLTYHWISRRMCLCPLTVEQSEAWVKKCSPTCKSSPYSKKGSPKESVSMLLHGRTVLTPTPPWTKQSEQRGGQRKETSFLNKCLYQKEKAGKWEQALWNRLWTSPWKVTEFYLLIPPGSAICYCTAKREQTFPWWASVKSPHCPLHPLEAALHIPRDPPQTLLPFDPLPTAERCASNEQACLRSISSGSTNRSSLKNPCECEWYQTPKLWLSTSEAFIEKTQINPLSKPI